MGIKKNSIALAIMGSTLFVSNPVLAAVAATTSTETSALVGHRPVDKKDGATEIKANGVLGPGETITINEFLYEDKDSDKLDQAETAKTVQWFTKDTAGTKTEIVSGKGKMSVVIPADATGKSLVVTYTLKTSTGTPAEAYKTTEITLNRTNADNITGGGSGGEIGMGAPIIANVTIKVPTNPTNEINGTDITGTPIVGMPIEADVKCDKGTVCEADSFDYKWLKDDGAGKFSEITGETSNIFTPTSDMQGRKFKVEVTPKASAGTFADSTKSDPKKLNTNKGHK
ncbi:ZirU family protein [Citrobacter portucalensis]|uniref:ZirU family protein n=1 Tax=Citrobacter portucalensis TaxID=1639133 RepID=UPI0039FBA0E5